MPDLRVYGSTTGEMNNFYFPFLDPDSSTGDYQTSDPSPSSSTDLILYLDGVAATGGAAASNATLSFLTGGYGKLALVTAQMQAEIIVAMIVDATATKEWVDTSIIIHTGGHASALHSG